MASCLSAPPPIQHFLFTKVDLGACYFGSILRLITISVEFATVYLDVCLCLVQYVLSLSSLLKVPFKIK